jgi:hypothetical protein
VKTLIPNQFLFRFALACRKTAWKPGAPLGVKHYVPFTGAMDEQREIADLRIGWSESGLIVDWYVPDKCEAIYGEADRPNACDGLTLWLDTRDVRSVHRATRYCHQFYLLAHGGDEKATPKVVQQPIHRAQENAPTVDVSRIALDRRPLDKEGKPATATKAAVKSYWMQACFPAETLNGFDPEVNSRLGIALRLRDREKGDQLWAPGPEFPYWEDPSLWSVLELVKG